MGIQHVSANDSSDGTMKKNALFSKSTSSLSISTINDLYKTCSFKEKLSPPPEPHLINCMDLLSENTEVLPEANTPKKLEQIEPVKQTEKSEKVGKNELQTTNPYVLRIIYYIIYSW